MTTKNGFAGVETVERAAVFLDRDGVLNANVLYEDSGLWEAPRTKDRYKMYPWTREALRLLQEAGFALILISNQPNAALGKSTAVQLAAVHEMMEHELRAAGVTLSASYYCFHHPNADAPSMRACLCRKPSPQMVLDAATLYRIDPRRSWMIGDRDSDIECGQRAGVRTIKVAPDHPRKPPGQQLVMADVEVTDLLEAAHFILKQKFSANLENGTNGTSTRSISSSPNSSKEELA